MNDEEMKARKEKLVRLIQKGVVHPEDWVAVQIRHYDRNTGEIQAENGKNLLGDDHLVWIKPVGILLKKKDGKLVEIEEDDGERKVEPCQIDSSQPSDAKTSAKDVMTIHKESAEEPMHTPDSAPVQSV